MRGFIGCFIVSMLLFIGWAFAAAGADFGHYEHLTSANEQIAMLKAQNQLIKEFQDGILSTLWSVIGMTVVVFGLIAVFQTRASERQVQSMVDVATRQLRQLSIEYAKVLLSSLRAGEKPRNEEEIDKLRDDIEDILEDLKLSDHERDEVMEREFPFTCRDYMDYISLPLIDKYGYYQFPTEVGTPISQFIIDHQLAGRAPTPAHVREFFQGNELYDADVEECLKDYEFFYKEKRHRRPHEWRTRQKRMHEAAQRAIAREQQASGPSAAASAGAGET